jgi:hypothetical protein
VDVNRELHDVRPKASLSSKTGDEGDKGTVTPWCGDFRFEYDDPFFAEAVRIGKYVDQKTRGNPTSEDTFRDAIDLLRRSAPAEGDVLVAELEHRWAHPLAPPALYVVTCEVCVHTNFRLVAGDSELGYETTMTKVGKAKRSLAPRISRYADEGIARVGVTPRTLSLRLAVFGSGPEMPREGELKQLAKANAVPLERVDMFGQRCAVTSESYAGDGVVAVIREHFRARQLDTSPRVPETGPIPVSPSHAAGPER